MTPSDKKYLDQQLKKIYRKILFDMIYNEHRRTRIGGALVGTKFIRKEMGDNRFVSIIHIQINDSEDFMHYGRLYTEPAEPGDGIWRPHIPITSDMECISDLKELSKKYGNDLYTSNVRKWYDECLVPELKTVIDAVNL